MTKVTKEFLENIIEDDNIYNTAGSGNIQRISEDVFSFVIYNFLPGTNPHGLDGHYGFAVNYKTFKYICWKDSDYGGLTYVKKIDDKCFIKIHKSIKNQIEKIIACKLYSSYFYDFKHINQKGNNLIEGCNIKCSLICDWRNESVPLREIEQIEKFAINKLQDNV